MPIALALLCALTFTTTSALQAQEGPISGQVVDQNTGEGALLATLIYLDTNNETIGGTTTDMDGFFTIEPPADAVRLRVTKVGYNDVVLNLPLEDGIRIEIEAQVEILDDLVVTALGFKKDQKSVGYAVQKVDAADFTSAKETNLINSLSGKLAGVNVVGSSNGVTASSNVTIRGQSSLTGNNQPLFVVNGLPITNGLNSPGDGLNGSTTIDFGNAASLINPYDIESISVLKGPAASALYGTRASDGVILITTKSGQAGAEGVSIDFTSDLVLSSVLRYPDYQNTFGGGAYGRRDYETGTQYFGTYDAFGESWGPRMDGRLVRQYDSNGQPAPFTPAPDNISNFFNTGVKNTNNIAINYRDQQNYFRMSATRLDQTGIVPNSDLTRNTFYLSGGTQYGENLSISGNMSYIDGGSDNVPNAGYDESSSIMYGWLWYPRNLPTSSLKDYWAVEDVQQANHEQLWTNNPYFLVNENTNSYQRQRFMGNLQVSYTFSPKLTARFRTSGDINNEGRQYRRALSTRGTSGERGSYQEDELYFKETNNEFLLTYDDNEFDRSLNYQVSVGGNMMRQEAANTSNFADGLVVPALYNLGNSLGDISTSQFRQAKEINSVFALAEFSFDNSIFLNVTGRNDWSSTLPTDNNSYFYPSVSLTAAVSDLLNIESDVLSFANLRAAYAEVGGDTDPYNTRNIYTYGNVWGGQFVASESALLRNPDLKPERTQSVELGTDLRFFDNKLRVDFTWYDIRSRDQIINLPLANSSGYDAKLINAGEIKNQGIELILSATAYQTDDLSWNTQLNFARNKSEVVSLAPGIDSYLIVPDMYPADGGQDLSLEARVGEPLGQLVGLDFQRVQSGQYAGQIIHENGLPVVNTSEKVSAGTYQPDFTFGWGNTVNYQNFSLSIQFDGRVGGKIFSRTHTMLASGGAITNEDDERLGSILVGRVELSPLNYDSNGNPPRDSNGNIIWGDPINDGSFVGPGVKSDGNGGYVANDVEVATRDYVYRYYNNIFNRDVITTGAYENTWVKLRELRLSYNLPTNLTDNLGITNASVSLVGRNLLLFTDVPSIDPETFSIRNGRIVQGFESTQIPSTRSFGLTVNIGI